MDPDSGRRRGSLDFPEGFERPDTQHDPPDHLLVADAAHRRIPAVRRGGAVVAHDEYLAVRHLVGQLDVAIPKGLFLDIGLVQRLAVHGDVAVFVDIHHFPAQCDDALHEDLVVVVEGADVAPVALAPAHRDEDVPIAQRRGHGASRRLQHRNEQRGHQDRCGSHHQQHGDGAQHRAAEVLVVSPPLQLALELRRCREGVLFFSQDSAFFLRCGKPAPG